MVDRRARLTETEKKDWLLTRDVVKKYGWHRKRWLAGARTGVVVTRFIGVEVGEVVAQRRGRTLLFSRVSIEAFLRGNLKWITIWGVEETYGYERQFWIKQLKAGEIIARIGDWGDGKGVRQYEKASIISFLARRRRNGYCDACRCVVTDILKHRDTVAHKQRLAMYRRNCQLNPGERQEDPRLVMGGISYPA